VSPSVARFVATIRPATVLIAHGLFVVLLRPRVIASRWADDCHELVLFSGAVGLEA
jgi:hypothetical protein